MAHEIERKFLVSEAPDRLEESSSARIEQGYLAVSERSEVRLRRSGEDLRLTVKRGAGEVREEVEVPIGRELFERLWPLTADARLTKTRYLLPLEGELEAEVDVYEGELHGLRVVEVEFDSAAASRGFQAPGWFGEELTGDRRYANQALASAGLPGAASANGSLPGGKMKAVASHGKSESKSYELKRSEGAAEGMRRIAAGRAEKALGRLGEIGAGEEADRVHGARKDMKKIRAVLRLLRGELGKKAYRAENRRYRDAGRLLGESRDAEVKLETLQGLAERFGDELPAAPTVAWRRALEADRRRLAAAGSDGLAEKVAQAVAMIEEGRERIPDWSLEADSWELLEPGLTRTYRDGRRALARARADRGTEAVHEFRKRSKDLWYELRLLRRAWPELLGPSAEQAHELADLLGDHHDLAVLAWDLGGRGEAVGEREEFERLIASRQEELWGRALGLGERLYAEKPNCFRRRIRAYWRAWRD